MIWRRITKNLIIGTLIVWVCYDVVAYLQHNDSTISVFVWAYSQEYPIIAFLAGVVCGHFFWTSQRIKIEDIK